MSQSKAQQNVTGYSEIQYAKLQYSAFNKNYQAFKKQENTTIRREINQ